MESITLFFREGSSDKVYQASIHPEGGGHMVHFAYGRRGSTLSTGSKTSKPVDLQSAKAIYDKLVRGKMAKGYKPGADFPVQVPVEDPKQPSGIQCQLLNPIQEKEADLLLFNPAYWMQEKMDGRRLLLRKQGDVITGINRLGFITSVPEPILASAIKYPGDFIVDGEAVGDILHAFDRWRRSSASGILVPISEAARSPRRVPPSSHPDCGCQLPATSGWLVFTNQE